MKIFLIFMRIWTRIFEMVLALIYRLWLIFSPTYGGFAFGRGGVRLINLFSLFFQVKGKREIFQNWNLNLIMKIGHCGLVPMVAFSWRPPLHCINRPMIFLLPLLNQFAGKLAHFSSKGAPRKFWLLIDCYYTFCVLIYASSLFLSATNLNLLTSYHHHPVVNLQCVH